METEQKRLPVLGGVGFGLLLIGWMLASFVANGLDFPRLALVVPFVASGCVLVVVSTRLNVSSWSFWGVLGISVFFLWRASLSPVYDLGRKDIVLIGAGACSFICGTSILGFRQGRAIFLVVLVLVFFGHACVALYQALVSSDFAFLRSSRIDQIGISGAYFHRNYFAGFLEIAVPCFVAVALVSGASRPVWAILAVIGVLLCYFTNSRGGFSAVLIGALVSFLKVNLGSIYGYFRDSRKCFVLVSISLLFVVVLTAFFMWSDVVAKRGGADDGLYGRLSMAGIGREIWLDSPLVGGGARSFSYKFPQHFSGLGDWYGDANMAHSEYIQLLSDYGAIGLVLVLLIFLLLVVQLVNFRSPASFEKNGKSDWLVGTALAILIAESLRAVFDFNLHILPNLMLFSLIVGGAVGNLASKDSSEQKALGQVFYNFLRPLFVFGVGALLMFASWRECLSLGSLYRFEKAKLFGANRYVALREYGERAPCFEVSRELGRHSLARALSGERAGGKFELAYSDWKEAVERHPFDGESLANLARSLDELGRFDEAEIYHELALKAVGRRENKYGVLYGYGWHLVRRAENENLERRPGQALFLYESALDVFSESSRRNFERQTLNRPTQQWVLQKIEFLKGARIEVKKLSILDWRALLD
ncbi:O-antigen ligase family protein [Roseibacillus persicicus]|uniref:O-antigen ligase family protein n=1 Tax=Roseibacillus persicicus TaxID=454148 RepID=UPI00398AB4BA